MKTIVRLLLLLCLALPASAASIDTTADLVIGQADFVTSVQNHLGVGAYGLALPMAVTVDGLGNLYAADYGNNRVLVYPAPLSSAMPASRVFGQPNLSMNNQNYGGRSATSLMLPNGLAVSGLTTGAAPDALYITDGGNNRVLRYNNPLSEDTTADRVFGQPGFTSGAANQGGVSESTLASPAGLALDNSGSLYVADNANHRVLVYHNPGGADANAAAAADRVFGQPDFTSGISNNGGVSRTSLNGPQGVAVDRLGNLYVADSLSNRVLIYTAPFTDTAADFVIGQASFNLNSPNRGGAAGPDTLNNPFGLAVDNAGTLYVSDFANHRILAFFDPLHTDLSADLVFGQPDFTTHSANDGGLNANSLASPMRLSLDRSGSLFAADMGNNRLLRYDLPPVTLPLYTLLAPVLLR